MTKKKSIRVILKDRLAGIWKKQNLKTLGFNNAKLNCIYIFQSHLLYKFWKINIYKPATSSCTKTFSRPVQKNKNKKTF